MIMLTHLKEQMLDRPRLDLLQNRHLAKYIPRGASRGLEHARNETILASMKFFSG
jgi:hypothetical protein